VTAAAADMVAVPAGELLMGSERFYLEEAPVRRVPVAAFAIDRHPVTVAEFAGFVDATGYTTLAERPPDPALYPGADPSLLVPGSLVFRPPAGPVSLRDHTAWWAWAPGASWRCPEGPGSDVRERAEHPVVHVAHEDAAAYAAWAGKALPTEAEWEWAARGGLVGKAFPWGDDPAPGGRALANTWQGRFPHENRADDGYAGTSPVTAFPPNGYGLLDAVGNVWEWTDSPWTRSHAERDLAAASGCCGPPAAGAIPQRVIKGGSHLCAPSYCLRFRPAARQGQPVDSATSHLGLRCVVR
jgi:formylglycine-generating enzyme required for sulfatase activity